MNYEDILEKVYSNIIFPGDCVIDIGAHSGRHCKPMAALAGRNGKVIAFEPNPAARDWLMDNVFDGIQNGSVVIMPYAISNVSKKMDFILANERPEESGLKKRKYNGPTTTKKIEVDVITLDSALRNETGSPVFIKIDVEGAEFDALKGARDTISSFKPIIAFEFGQASYESYNVDPGDVYDYFDSLGYRLYSILGAPLKKESFIDASRVQSFWDYIACPIEKIKLLENTFSLVSENSDTLPAATPVGLLKSLKNSLRKIFKPTLGDKK